MKSLFFSKSDFKPHIKDGLAPLGVRCSNTTIIAIILGKSSMRATPVTIKKGKITVGPETLIDEPLNEESGQKLRQSFGCEHIAATYNHSLHVSRECLAFRGTSKELALALSNAPQSILKSAYQEGRRHALLSHPKADLSLLFSADKAQLQEIEQLLAPLRVIRLQHSMYSLLNYLLHHCTIAPGLLLLVNDDALLCLKIEQNTWGPVSFRNFGDVAAVGAILDEVLPALAPNGNVSWVNTSGFDIAAYLGERENEQLLPATDNLTVQALCYG